MLLSALFLLGMGALFAQPAQDTMPTNQEILSTFKEYRENLADQLMQCTINVKTLTRQLEKVKAELEAIRPVPK